DVAYGLAHSSAETAIDDRARIFAQAGGRQAAALELFACERADDQPPRPFERRHSCAQRNATKDASELHTGTFGCFSSTSPTTIQRAGLLSSPTALRAAIPSEEMTTRWCIPAP